MLRLSRRLSLPEREMVPMFSEIFSRNSSSLSR